jgi:hypothetical protein
MNKRLDERMLLLKFRGVLYSLSASEDMTLVLPAAFVRHLPKTSSIQYRS